MTVSTARVAKGKIKFQELEQENIKRGNKKLKNVKLKTNFSNPRQATQKIGQIPGLELGQGEQKGTVRPSTTPSTKCRGNYCDGGEGGDERDEMNYPD